VASRRCRATKFKGTSLRRYWGRIRWRRSTRHSPATACARCPTGQTSQVFGGRGGADNRQFAMKICCRGGERNRNTVAPSSTRPRSVKLTHANVIASESEPGKRTPTHHGFFPRGACGCAFKRRLQLRKGARTKSLRAALDCVHDRPVRSLRCESPTHPGETRSQEDDGLRYYRMTEISPTGYREWWSLNRRGNSVRGSELHESDRSRRNADGRADGSYARWPHACRQKRLVDVRARTRFR